MSRDPEQYTELELEEAGHPTGVPPPQTVSKKKLYIIGGLAGGLALLLVIIFAATAKPKDNPHQPKRPWPVESRLPDAVNPTAYAIEIDTKFKQDGYERDTFSGTVVIDVDVTGEILYLPIHAHKLDITFSDVRLVSGSDNLVVDERSYPSEEYQLFVMKLSRHVPANSKLTVRMEFSANLTASLAGYYLSSYKLQTGQTEYLATTQFEPTDARAAFPCFDEPAKKAIFTMRLITDSGYKAIANGKSLGTDTQTDGRIVHTFEPSPKMSTYLVAYCVFKFASRSGIAAATNQSTNVAVWSRQDELPQTQFALTFTQKCLAYYEKLFGIPFPLPKTDLVAIPDFAAGAMENWGLITYREADLLFDPAEGSSAVKQRVATVIAHELAHQWFGNLVTMEWWDDLWLNEGFASVIEYMGVADTFHEDMDMEDQFLILAQYSGLFADALRSSHPIHVKVQYPYEINSIFDSISYDKGASVLRMLRDFLTPDVFFSGLHNYLTANAYGNADTNELWRRLAEAATAKGNPVDVAAVMDSWVTKAGYPVLEVKQSGATTTITQYPFTYTGQPGTAYTWKVPVRYTSVQGTNAAVQKSIVMSDPSVAIPEGATLSCTGGGKDYLKINSKQSGFFITAYDKPYRDCLVADLNQATPTLGPADRAGIMQDGFRLTHAGTWSNPSSGMTFKASDILAMTPFLAKENHYVVWAMAELGFARISKVLGDEATGSVQADFSKYVLNLATARLTEALGMIGKDNSSLCSVSWPAGTTSIQRELYDTILRTGASHGHAGTVAKLSACFSQFEADATTVIDPDIRRLVYSVAVASLGQRAYDVLWARYINTVIVSERISCMYALAAAKDAGLIERTLNAILQGEVRSQDAPSLLGRMAYNPAAQSRVWAFIKANWDTLAPTGGLSGIGSESQIIKRTVPAFTTQDLYDDAKSFFTETKPVTEGKKALANSLEYVESNIRWVTTSKADVITYCQNANKAVVM